MNQKTATFLRQLVPTGSLAVLVALFLPMLFGSLWDRVFTGAVIFAIPAAGIAVLYGRLGLVSLAGFALVGVGGWASLRLYFLWHLPFVVNMLLGGIIAAVVGTIIGLPALRLRGLYLALVTLLAAGAFSVVVTVIGFPSGGSGFNGRGGDGNMKFMPRPSFAKGDHAYFRFVVIVAAVMFLLVIAHQRLRPGRPWAMIRKSQAAALSAGVNVTLYKTWAFTLAGFLAGVAGALQAGLVSTLKNSEFDAVASLLLFALTVSAGAFHLFGAVLAGVLAKVLPALFKEWDINADLANMIFGFLLLVSLTATPEGAAGQLIGLGKMIWAKTIGRNRPEPNFALADVSVPPVGDDRYAESMIALRGVTVQFGGVKPLNNLDLDLSGRIIGIVGPNGAGKTTLLNVLSGFVQPIEGTVSVDGTDLLTMNPYQRARWGLRRTFQTEQVVDNLTVYENVDVMLDSSGLSLSERRQAVQEALRVTGLAQHAYALAGTLNAYERRMVEITRAIAGKPRIIMMDEPAAGLSEMETAQFRDIMLTLPARTGATILLIDHDVDLIASLCENSAVLDFGKLITFGPTRQVLDDDRVKAAYLGVAIDETEEVDA